MLYSGTDPESYITKYASIRRYKIITNAICVSGTLAAAETVRFRCVEHEFRVSKTSSSMHYFTEMCSGSEAGSYLRLIDFVYHSTLGLRVIKKKKKFKHAHRGQSRRALCTESAPSAPVRF